MRRTATIILLVTCNVGCNAFRDGTASGWVEAKGTAGAWVFEKGKCFSGQREQYFGLIALGPEGSGQAIKLVKDGIRGWSAVINRPETCKGGGAEKPDCRAVMLTAESCTTLDVDVRNTSMTVNDIRVVEGSLTIDCSNETGSIRGKLTFDHCH
jgi:hypothetical protein